jgi:AraC-like DNA-binding protein
MCLKGLVWTPAVAHAQRLRVLARLRSVRDQIDREYAQALDVEALAHNVHMSVGYLNRQFEVAYGESLDSYAETRRRSSERWTQSQAGRGGDVAPVAVMPPPSPTNFSDA